MDRCTYCGAPDNGTCAYPSEGRPNCLATEPFTLVCHSETEFWAACLWPQPISGLPRILTDVEVRLLREDLRRACVPRALEHAIAHVGACSNSNAVNPVGRFQGVAECGCRGRTHVG